MLMCLCAWLEYRRVLDRVRLGMDCLADERASGGITHGDAHELLEGLLLGHLVGLGALLLHG